MSVRIQYFAGLREALGMGGEEIELPASVATVGALRDWLAGQGRDALATAKNFAALTTLMPDGQVDYFSKDWLELVDLA